jgi:arylsulfatase A-like enzyme
MSYECIGKNWARAVNSPFAKHKITSHEGGVCSPLIVHWPKKVTSPGAFNDTPVHLVDFMSTVIDVSGGQYPNTFSDKPTKPIDGVSIAPAIYGKAIAARTVPIGYDYGLGQGIRDGNWKLVKFGNKPWELYDMDKDRTETNNLAKQHPEKVNELNKKHQQWLQRCSSAPQ